MSARRWRRKDELDSVTDGWSPVPTRIVSNEEYLPLPPNPEQQRVAHRLREASGLHAARLGLTRRQFLASPCGMAAAFLAMNQVFGRQRGQRVPPAADRRPGSVSPGLQS